MTLRQIEIVRALVRHRTTAAAARHLGMSQPAVSTAIRHIEALLGIPLFERVNNRLFPLEAAAVILDETEPMFAMHAAFAERLKDLKQDKYSRLNLLSTPPLGQRVIPLALAAFARRHPRARTYFDIRDLDDVRRRVESGKADLGVGLGIELHADLTGEVLHEDRMVVVCTADHPLAKRSVVTPSDLSRHRLIALEADTRMGGQVREAFTAVGEPFASHIEVRTCSTACALVEAGLGVSVVDPFSARHGTAGRLSILPFEPVIPSLAWAFWPNRKPIADTAKRFLNEIRLILSYGNDRP